MQMRPLSLRTMANEVPKDKNNANELLRQRTMTNDFAKHKNNANETAKQVNDGK